MTQNPLTPALVETLETVARGSGLIVVLTGAGVSAESGIPTFRGPEGFWRIGSRNYTSQEMATRAMFTRHPDAVWQWYLYRRTLCGRAKPNAAHHALAALDRALGARFLLVTQNVDGLHRRAGHAPERTYPIHGNIHTMRCAASCTRATWPIPSCVGDKERDDPITKADRAALTCPTCGGPARPHVLWFDECYDEEHYRLESSLGAAARAALLITAGTSGATNLPLRMGAVAARHGVPLVDVNPGPNPFSRLAVSSGGHFCPGPASVLLPWIARCLGVRVAEENEG